MHGGGCCAYDRGLLHRWAEDTSQGSRAIFKELIVHAHITTTYSIHPVHKYPAYTLPFQPFLMSSINQIGSQYMHILILREHLTEEGIDNM